MEVTHALVDLSDVFKGTYVVQKGDTLFKLGMKFNIKASKLQIVNNLLNETLYEGQVRQLRFTFQVLKVPSDLEGLESIRKAQLADAKEQMEAIKEQSSQIIEEKNKIRQKMLVMNQVSTYELDEDAVFVGHQKQNDQRPVLEE